jgi:hypothetical protein
MASTFSRRSSLRSFCALDHWPRAARFFLHAWRAPGHIVTAEENHELLLHYANLDALELRQGCGNWCF